MRKILAILFVTIYVFSTAQSNYQRNLFQTVSTGSVSQVVYTNDYNTTTLIIKNLLGPMPYSNFSTLTKFTTTTGNVTSSKTFSISGYDLAIHHVVKNNQMLYIIASLTNSSTVTGCIIKYNLSSNATVWRRTVNINQPNYTLNKITYDNDKYLYALGSDSTLNSTNRLFISKLDTNGNLVWIKTIGTPTLFQKPTDIFYTNKRELYVSSIGVINASTRTINLRLDSSGTVLNSAILTTASFGGFQESFSAILKGKLTTVYKTAMPNGDAGPFLIQSMDTNLNVVVSKILDGVNIKQIYSNTNNLLINGLAPINNGLKGFRTVRLDTTFTLIGAKYFKKINTTSNTSSAACYINGTNNSFHFFKSNVSDTIVVVKADGYEGVGCNDTIFTPITTNLTFSVLSNSFSTSVISGTLATITMPIGSITYSSNSLCAALTTNINSVFEDEFISIYPNPSKDILNVKFASFDQQYKHIQILNSLGQVLVDEPVALENLAFDISSFSNGIYFLRINSIKGSKILKVVKM